MSYAPLGEGSERSGGSSASAGAISSNGGGGGDRIVVNGGESGGAGPPSPPPSSSLVSSIGRKVQSYNRNSLSEPLTKQDAATTAQQVNGGDNDNGDALSVASSGNASSGRRIAARRDGSADPYYVFRADLEKKIELVDESLAEYLRVVHRTDTAVNVHEVKDAKKQLKRCMKNAESTLKDVHTAVQLIESSSDSRSGRFAGLIDDAELYERKTFVNQSRLRLTRAKDEGQSEAVKAKLLADERAKALRRVAGARAAAAGNFGDGGPDDGGRDGSSNSNNNIHSANTDFVVDSHARTSLLMQHQEETLDELDVAVQRVGVMAGGIHEEIGQQNKMLGEMEEDLADAEEQLGLVMGKLAKFLKTKDRWQLGTIVGLFLTMLVLLFLVIYF